MIIIAINCVPFVGACVRISGSSGSNRMMHEWNYGSATSLRAYRPKNCDNLIKRADSRSLQCQRCQSRRLVKRLPTHLQFTLFKIRKSAMQTH